MEEWTFLRDDALSTYCVRRGRLAAYFFFAFIIRLAINEGLDIGEHLLSDLPGV